MIPESQQTKSTREMTHQKYWRSTLRLMFSLLFLWAAAGLGAGILIADYLNNYTLPGTGFPLGFWFAHQGSILVFVLLILLYCILMNRIDQRHDSERRQDSPGHPQ